MNHKHRWMRLRKLDSVTEIVECANCPARVARLCSKKKEEAR